MDLEITLLITKPIGYGSNIQPYTHEHIVYPLAYGDANNKINLHMKVIHWWRTALFSHMREQSRTPGLCVPVLPGVPWPQIRLHHVSSSSVRSHRGQEMPHHYILFVHSVHNEWTFLQECSFYEIWKRVYYIRHSSPSCDPTFGTSYKRGIPFPHFSGKNLGL